MTVLAALLRLALLPLAASLPLELSRLSVVGGENTGWLGLRSCALDTRGAVPCGFKLPRRSALLPPAEMELRGGAWGPGRPPFREMRLRVGLRKDTEG